MALKGGTDNNGLTISACDNITIGECVRGDELLVGWTNDPVWIEGLGWSISMKGLTYNFIWREYFHGGRIMEVNGEKVDTVATQPRFKYELSCEVLENRHLYLNGSKGYTKTQFKNMMMYNTLDKLREVCDEVGLLYSPTDKIGVLKELISNFATNN